MDQIAHVGQPEYKPWANRPWNCFRNISTYVISYPNVRHRRTDRRHAAA